MTINKDTEYESLERLHNELNEQYEACKKQLMLKSKELQLEKRWGQHQELCLKEKGTDIIEVTKLLEASRASKRKEAEALQRLKESCTATIKLAFDLTYNTKSNILKICGMATKTNNQLQVLFIQVDGLLNQHKPLNHYPLLEFPCPASLYEEEELPANSVVPPFIDEELGPSLADELKYEEVEPNNELVDNITCIPESSLSIASASKGAEHAEVEDLALVPQNIEYLGSLSCRRSKQSQQVKSRPERLKSIHKSIMKYEPKFQQWTCNPYSFWWVAIETHSLGISLPRKKRPPQNTKVEMMRRIIAILIQQREPCNKIQPADLMFGNGLEDVLSKVGFHMAFYCSILLR